MTPAPSRGNRLPIDDVLPELLAAFGVNPSVVLQAPPGAGKTTRVPLALLDAPWLGGNRILMLEPRRLATRAAARRMSDTLGESVGTTVGYRVRGETRVSQSTRIEVITEGVLTRMLLDDPALDGVGAVLFDEFHERSLNADFGLALALQGQALLRPDLRILVMSATLDGDAVAALLGDAPVVTSIGQAYPVVLRYHPCRADFRIEACVAQVVRTALENDEGGVLAFLPGAGEIRRCLALLERANLGGDVRLFPLYGDLPVERQDAAIAPAPPGVRKVVLATSIAETSLTIDGVRVVVDSGVARVSRFSSRTGMARLETIRASRSSVDQRSGRAGRTTAGVSYRLWSEHEQAHLPDRGRAEMLDADLAPLALDLAAAGIRDPADLRWLDAPPLPALAHARTLLRQLDALDEEVRITPHGRAMARLGLHPRLSHMVLVAQERGMGATACVVAALVEERDVLAREAAARDRDLRTRVAIVLERSVASEVDRDALRRVRDRSLVLRQLIGVARDEQADPALTGAVLALAYPERVAQRRAGSVDRYLMRNGMGVLLEDAGSLGGADYLVVADLDGRVPHARVYLATSVDLVDVEALFLREFVINEDIAWHADTGTVTAVRREQLGAIVLREAVVPDPDAGRVMDVITTAIVDGDGIGLPWSRDARDFVERVAFLRSHGHRLPNMSESALLESAREWLRPHLVGVRRRSQVER
ncbi:MAG: ATP-dependent helicase HrpB, partial [Gemmatimonadota bacterium]|nr:ATP-dependent helicase HrpB [Gemmatimonadota bacterium]